MSKCRVCGQEVKKGMGMQSHVLKHKREFCRAIGRAEGEAWRVNWEDVVLFYNPDLADKSKCIGYPMEHAKKQKKLGEY